MDISHGRSGKARTPKCRYITKEGYNMTKEQEKIIKEATTNGVDRADAILQGIKAYHELMIEEAKKTAEAYGDFDSEELEKQAYDKGFRDGQIKCNDDYYVGFQKGYSMGEDDAKKELQKNHC